MLDCGQSIQLSSFKRSCSSNLFADKIKSIAALRILELSVGLSEVFPKSKVCLKTLLVFSNKMQLKLFKLLRRVRLSLPNWGQWRRKCFVDYTSFSQLHSGFNVSWKPCLNFCSCNKTNSSSIVAIIKWVWRWSYEIKNIALKIEEFSDFLGWGSSLFHSIMEKTFLKKLWQGRYYVYFELSITSVW